MDDGNIPDFIPFKPYIHVTEDEMYNRADSFYQIVRQRRTVREFSEKPVPRKVIEMCLRTAGTAPNGANIQPWHFVAVTDPKTKNQIRIAAENEEREFYQRRAPSEWLEVLQPFATDWEKPYLEIAPVLIAIFARKYNQLPEGQIIKHYYVQESVGIATGLLITAIHYAGLVCLTHTPSPMGFLNEILSRPEEEKPFLLLVVGYPAENAKVPNIRKKNLDEISTFI